MTVGVCLLLLGVLGAPILQDSTVDSDDRWIRRLEVLDDAGMPVRSALEIATQRFESTEEDGRGDVSLVGVTHIGDATYYEALREQLDRYDLVLYESVAPDGTKGVGGQDAAERARNTRSAMRFVGMVLEWHRAGAGALPSDLSDLITRSGELDSRFPGWLASATRDAWNAPLRFEPVEVAADPGADPDTPIRVEWRLTSFGADGREGGADEAADLVLESTSLNVPPRSRGGMQAQIASALGLSFQLHALDYSDDDWLLADMTESELRRTAEDRQVDVAPLLEGLGGGGVTARLGRTVLMLLRIADFFSGNQVRDIVKVVLVEALSDPAALDMAQGGMPGMDGLMDLILNERNRVALEDLDRVRALHPDRSIAIFYGAAHMPGLAEGLRERGYHPVGDREWEPAIDIDLEASQVDPATMRMIRSRIGSSLSAGPSGPAAE